MEAGFVVRILAKLETLPLQVSC